MRAFKKIMASAVATVVAVSMATSAIAVGFDAATGKVNVTSEEFTAEGQTTVLIVPAGVWQSEQITNLTNDDIKYINQYDTATDANDAIVAGFGVKLDAEGKLADGDYVALFGYEGVGGFAIKALSFTVSSATPEPTDEPTAEPTDEPTAEPTDEPTAEPTDEPTAEPTDEPTAEPTDEPTAEPTDEPTAEPTDEPTAEPIQLGDCDGIAGIDTGDVLAIFSHIAETATLTGDALIAADCDGIAGIDTGDVLAIFSHIAETALLGKVTK